MNVSVVIPTFNRKFILEKCLKALEKQNLNNIISDYEIVVVDDGSSDGTPSWIRDNNIKILTNFYLINIFKLNHNKLQKEERIPQKSKIYEIKSIK